MAARRVEPSVLTNGSSGGEPGRGLLKERAYAEIKREVLANQEILRVMGQLRDKTHRVIFRVFTIDGQRMVRSCEEHQSIAEAVIRGEPALAASRIEAHLRFGMESLVPRRA